MAVNVELGKERKRKKEGARETEREFPMLRTRWPDNGKSGERTTCRIQKKAKKSFRKSHVNFPLIYSCHDIIPVDNIVPR